MSDSVKLVVADGQRKLQAVGWPNESASAIRILTGEQIQALGDGDWHLYRKRVRELIRHVSTNATLTDPDTIRAYDYLRHAIERETQRRETVTLL